MDENTRDVLMAILEIVSIIITALMVVYVARSNNKLDKVGTKIATVDEKVELQNNKLVTVQSNVELVDQKVAIVETKLDESHKQMNGNLTKLLQTTTDLATEKEKAKHK
jgi:septal ring factor EnvC (AmiA/AmiB activator)